MPTSHLPFLSVAASAVLAASLTRCGACEPSRGPEPAPSASAAPSAAARPPVAPSASVFRPPRPHMLCKIIEGHGDVRLDIGTDAGPPLMVNAPIAPNWVNLPADGRFVVKDPRTARETTFRGPGRVKVCVMLDEESWIASGGFDSSVGSGEAPGLEEWVVTPLGVIRYNSAKLSVDVRGRDAHGSIASGGAFLWLPSDATARGGEAGALTKGDDGWMRLGVDTFTLASTAATGPLTLDGARAAVAACASLGKAAHELSAILLAGAADAGTIMSQVATRRMARAACAVAGLRLGSLPASPQLAPLNAQLSEGTAAWNSLPDSPASPPAPPPAPPP